MSQQRPISRSIITLEVIPETSTADLTILESRIRKISIDGLLEWGPCNLIPITLANGAKFHKMTISVIVEDKKVTIADVAGIQYTIEVDDVNLVKTAFVGCERYYDDDDEEEDIEEEEDEEMLIDVRSLAISRMEECGGEEHD